MARKGKVPQAPKEVFKLNKLASLNPNLKAIMKDPAAIQKLGAAVEAVRKSHTGDEKDNLRAFELVDAAYLKDAEGKRVYKDGIPQWADSPLSRVFDHNETEAARKWNIQQAGHLLNCLEVTYIGPREIPVTHDYSVSIETPVGRRYTTLARVMDDAELRLEFLQMIQDQIDEWEDKLSHYKELETVLKPRMEDFKYAIEDARRLDVRS